MESEPDIEQQIDEMFERLDNNYSHMMDKEVQRVRDIARLRDIQAEMGRLALQRREIDYRWQELVAERIELTHPSPS